MRSRGWIQVLRAGLLLAVAILGGCSGAVGGAAAANGAAAPIPSVAPIPAAPVVSKLECKEKEFRVDLLDALEALPDDTLEAQREQLRDWVWTVTLGRLAVGTSAEEMLAGVGDLPVGRDGALAHVLAMPVGPARAATTKSGDVVVMVEHGAQEATDAAVLEAIDQEALYLGHPPGRAHLYEYEIQSETAVARVCAMGTLEGAELASAARGQRSAQIKSAADLERFLAGGVDLLSAECTDAGLAVTGRTRPRNTRGGEVFVEHVAAIAKRLVLGYLPPERFGKTVAGLPKEQRDSLERTARAMDNLLANPTTIDAALGRFSPEDQRAFRAMLAWKQSSPSARSVDVALSYQLQSAFASRRGFSLDPLTTKAAALQGMDEAIAALADGESVARLYRSWGSDKAGAYYRDAITKEGPVVLEDAGRDLAKGRKLLAGASDQVVDKILRGWLSGGSLGDRLAASLMWGVYEANSRQCARYDGPLAGTATGMTLFYTDLLAKVWDFDWNGSAPEDAIAGFTSTVHQTGSTASCQEEKHPATRTWFGLREEHYARQPSGRVQFAPVATRIFAKGSQFGHDEEEVEPDANEVRRIRFWDDHYAAIASWEPQYEVLNQIMKWSVVAQSAAIAGKSGCLGFFDAVEPSSDRRFDQWVASTPALRFRGPVKLVAEASTSTECLPLLRSEAFTTCGEPLHMSGGVSAATRAQVSGKAARGAAVRADLGRFAESKASSVKPARTRFEKVSRGGAELPSVEIEIHPRSTAFRAEMPPSVAKGGGAPWTKDSPVRSVEKTVDIDATNSLVAQQRKNGVLTQELRASDLTRAEVRVAVKEGAEAAAQKIVQHIMDADSTLPAAAAAVLPGRESFALPDGSLAVRFPGAKPGKGHYAIMESGVGNRGPPSTLGKFRIGAKDGGAHAPGSPNGAAINVTLLSEDAGAAYVKQKAGTPIAARDSAPEQVEKLANGDAAMIQRISDRVSSGNASAPELQRLGDSVDRASALLRRNGADVEALSQLRLRISIGKSKQLMPGLREQRVLAARAGDMGWYAPPEYPTSAGLPPAVHPAGKPLPPSERYVSRLLEESHAQSAPAQIQVDGAEFGRRGPPGDGSNAGRGTGAAAIGSPYRLLSGWAPRPMLAVVVACQDDDDGGHSGLPPCHARPSREAREEREGMQRKFQAAITACDQDKSGGISSDVEKACVNAELKKVHMQLVPRERP